MAVMARVAELSWYSHGCHSASQNELEKENDMTEIKEKEIRATPEAAPEAARLTMMSGNKTFIIGLHFSETGKDTLEDKVKKLIKKDVEDGNF